VKSDKIKMFQKLTDYLIVILFLCTISAPLVSTITRETKSVSEMEQRKLAMLPELKFDIKSLIRYPLSFQTFFNDNFGFRDDLVRIHNYLMVFLLKTSPDKHFIIGRDGWIFDNWQDSVDYYRGIKPFTREQLHTWRQVLETRKNQLDRLGIKYLVVVIPNKHTIYPEFLPQSLNRVSGISRLDQLLRYLGTDSGVTVLDLRGPLFSAKDKGLLYGTTDSHWNDLGVFSAYREIIRKLSIWFPQLHALPRKAFETRIVIEKGGDVARILGLEDVMGEKQPVLTPLHPLEKKSGTLDVYWRYMLAGRGWPIVLENAGSKLPSAVIFHDSFVYPFMRELLSEHFRRVVFVGQSKKWVMKFDLDFIKKEHPDVVIEMFVERRLMSPELWGFDPLTNTLSGNETDVTE